MRPSRSRTLPALLLLCVPCAACGDDDAPEPVCEEPLEIPAARYRVFAVGHRFDVATLVTAEDFARQVRETVEGDVAPSLAADAPNLLVFPEDIGLLCALVGPRAANARAQDLSTEAFTAIAGDSLDAMAFYGERFPSAPPGRLVTLAVTDPAWRCFDGTFAAIARDYGVWVSATGVFGDVEVASDPAVAAAVGDPDRPAGAPVYWTPSGLVYNVAVHWGPDGLVAGRHYKAYLTDPENELLNLEGGLPERLGPIVLADGRMRLASMISRDAWMQDALERTALLGADVVMQHEAYFGSIWASQSGYGPWTPDNLKRSGWAAVQKYPEYRAAVAPMLVGNLFEIPIDGQTFAAVDGAPAQPLRALLAQEPDTGWAAIGPWAFDDPMTGTLEERRQALIALGETLAPGGANAGAYVQGTVFVDVDIPAGDGHPPAPDAAPGSETPVLGPSMPFAPAPAGRQRTVALAADAEGLVAAWEDARHCAGQIYAGRPGAAPVRVAPSSRAQRTPTLAVLGEGTLLLAWQEDGRVASARSEDGGATWSRPVVVDEAAVDAWKPALAADGAIAHLVFVDSRDGRNRRVQITRSSDGGRSWEPARRLDPRDTSAAPDVTYGNEWSPAIAARDGRVVVAYTHRQRPLAAEQPSHDAHVIVSEDGGASFGEPVRLDPDETTQERIAADLQVSLAGDGRWRVVWSSLRGAAPDADVALAVEGETGLASAPDAPLARDQWFPSLSGDAVVWQDFRGGSNDVYMARLAGAAFGAPQRVDDAGGSAAQSWRPRVLVVGDEAWVVWEDSRSGRAELRWARGALPP